MRIRILSIFTNSLVFIALVVSPLVSPAVAGSQLTFTVTANTDVVDATPGDGVCETETGNGMCTLRAAIMEANAHVGADTIILPAAEYNLTLPGADEDLSASGDLDITDSLTITGAGSMDTVIDANAVDERVLTVFLTNDPVTISGVKIQSGTSLTSNGGGIVNYSDLILEDVYFWLNQAGLYGGGIWNQNSLTMSGVSFLMNSAAMRGGGVYSIGSILSEDDYFGANTSEGEGGGLYATSSSNVHLVSADFNSNRAATDGGSIYTAGELTIEDSVIVLGETGNAGGGIFFEDNATATLTKVVFRDNHAGTGGGIWMGENGTITGNDLQFSLNSADGLGGAINNVKGNIQLHQIEFRENDAGSGGAIAALLGSTVLHESEIISNTASMYGGGILNNGNVSLIGTTLNENRAEKGGGIYNNNTLLIENSTISGNRADDDGGGVYDSGGVQISIYNSTITANLAGADIMNPGGEGGGIYNTQLLANFRNTVLSGNRRRVLVNFVDDDCHGVIESGDYNLIGTLTNCIKSLADHDIIGEDPLLGELADNGGWNQTHALLEGSPAIDGGNPEGCLGIEDALLTSDQRGVARPLDGDKDGSAVCDIGAYELSNYTYVYLPYAGK
jgi:predicted outer membrane repeat protein